MGLKKIAPYGRWQSALSAEAATAGSRTLTSPRSCRHSGRGFLLVSMPDGASTIVEVGEAGSEPESVLPEPWRVGTTVYEYGGQAYAILPPARDASQASAAAHVRILFADPRDNSCNILDVDSGAVTTLVPGNPALRYADFDAYPGSHGPGSSWVLAVQEDHTQPLPADVRNYVVAIHLDTGDVVRLVSGADFYSYPRFSPESSPTVANAAHADDPGCRISWRQWDHPDLPFDGATLHWAKWHPARPQNGSAGQMLTGLAQVAGDHRQCVAEAAWSPDGSLVFSMEQTGSRFRQLFRAEPTSPGPKPIVLKGFEDVEFGDASFMVGCQTFVFLTSSTLVAVGTRLGKNELVYADLDADLCILLDIGLVEMKFDPLAPLSPTSFLVVGSGFTTPSALYRVQLDLGRMQARPAANADSFATATLVYRSTEQALAPDVFSAPQLVRIPAAATDSAPARTVFGWFWPPHNRDFTAPPGTRPPLIISPHGGPTAYSAPGLHMVTQYWATRGFAFFAINYSGSSGHGRAYRDILWTRWGLVDCDDVAASAAFLADEEAAAAESDSAAQRGRRIAVDRARVGIEGGSAGGYNVLQSLVRYPALFAGGVCCCGVADTAALDRDTHKLESHYCEKLLWPPGTSAADKARIHHERSPIFHADRITTPLRLIHGELDTVVPIQQSEGIRDSIRARGGDVDLVVLPGEGHMFKKAESMIRYLEAEAEWWDKTLLK